jgi:hypothetical protein
MSNVNKPNRRFRLELPGRRDLAAAWWSASLRARAPAVGNDLIGRWAPAPLVWAGAAGLVGAAGLTASGCAELFEEDGQPSSMQVAQALQREQGWTAGEPAALYFPDAQQTDVAGGADWRAAMATLALRLAPAEPRWQPFYDPTLFQALQAPRNADLRMLMQPVFSPAMAVASRRGEGVLSLFVDGSCRNDVALVIDVPGPEAVALAAALAPCFDPVFAFDNWPHPRGIVPSHLTLGAALYYLPWFERERSGRAADAAPMFIFDRQRLAPYVDDSKWFDNRYLAGLPPREVFEAAGIRHILYVVPDGQVDAEADDLNDDMVGLDRGGIDVRLLALSDFSETPLPGWSEDELPSPDPDPTAPPPPPDPQPQFSFGFYFGGSARTHACFWDWYGWRAWRGRPLPPPHNPPPLPPSLRPRATFHPAPRPTFSGGSGWHGTPTGGGARGGIWRGAPVGRSGSLGRAHFGGGMSG